MDLSDIAFDAVTIPEIAEAARARLVGYAGRYTEIAQRNPELSLSWLSKFANGKTDNPTVGTLQNLIDALNALDAEATTP